MKALINNLRTESFWVRLGFMLLFTIVLEIALPLLIILVWLQFIYRLITGKVQDDLFKFISSATQFVYQVYCFLSYQTDTKPFPFSDWPTPKAVPAQAAEQSEQQQEQQQEQQPDQQQEQQPDQQTEPDTTEEAATEKPAED